jgi:hypothetical protein
MGVEAIVSKRMSAPNRFGSCRDWLKKRTRTAPRYDTSAGSGVVVPPCPTHAPATSHYGQASSSGNKARAGTASNRRCQPNGTLGGAAKKRGVDIWHDSTSVAVECHIIRNLVSTMRGRAQDIRDVGQGKAPESVICHGRSPTPLPPPWRTDGVPGGYVVRDANGKSIAHVYSRDDPKEMPVGRAPAHHAVQKTR